MRGRIERRTGDLVGLALAGALLVAGCHLIYPFGVAPAVDAGALDAPPLEAGGDTAGEAPASDVSAPKRVPFTVAVVDWAAGTFMPGFNVCVPQDSSLPCAKTAGTPIPSATLDVRDDMDISLLVVKAGYVPLELFRGKKSGIASITHMVWPFSAKGKLEAGAGGTVDFTQGHLVVSVYSSAGVAADETGATVDISPLKGAGPVYAGTDGWPDAGQTMTTSRAWVFFFNLAAGSHTVSVDSKAGTSCSVRRGWQGTGAQTSIVPIAAGRLASVAFICP